jgi:hypothetical protein
MRVVIIDIHPRDEFYRERALLIGKEGNFRASASVGEEFYSGTLELDEIVELPIHGEIREPYFFGIKVKIIKEKEKDFSGPTKKVRCINNSEVEYLISVGNVYSVIYESKTFYHIKTDKGCQSYFAKNMFLRIA